MLAVSCFYPSQNICHWQNIKGSHTFWITAPIFTDTSLWGSQLVYMSTADDLKAFNYTYLSTIFSVIITEKGKEEELRYIQYLLCVRHNVRYFK